MSANAPKLALGQTFNWKLTTAVCLIAFSQFNFGFDQQGFAATQAMDDFDRRFGTYSEQQKMWILEPVWLSLFNSLPYIGFVTVGLILGSSVSKHFGRRMCMFSMSCWAIVCAVIVVTSQSRSQIMAGRVLNYIYIGMELSVVPIYQSELVPAHARGFVVATYQTSLVFGSLLMNLICLGTSTLPGKESWQIPLGLFFVIPTIVAALIWFLPESPRWLATKGLHEEGLAALVEVRKGKFTQEQIETEYGIIRLSTAQNVEKGTFFEQFNQINRKRTFIVLMVNFFLQASGQLFTTIYGAIYVKSLGTVNPFHITVSTSLINLTFGVLAMFMIEKIGRRRLLMLGGTIQCSALFIMGGLGTISPSTTGVKAAIVAMMLVYAAGFASGWAPIVHALSAELPSQPLRDMSYRTGSAVNVIMQFLVSFTLPYLLFAPYAALSSKVGFVFGAFAAMSVVFSYFCVPEVRGKSLEEIDRLFLAGVPMRQFRHTNLTLEAELAGDSSKGVGNHVEDA
ncbi:general substrate transporter [Thozetella sp. PMI_491]|nr:general substrate transporter [Thozetella sp. PMI_491]